jgi:hypothetical protein
MLRNSIILVFLAEKAQSIQMIDQNPLDISQDQQQ